MGNKILGRVGADGNFSIYSTGSAQFDEANYSSKSGPNFIGTFFYSNLYENAVLDNANPLKIDTETVPARQFSDDSLVVYNEFVEQGVDISVTNVASSSLINEGDSITFDISTSNFADGQIMYYEIVSNPVYVITPSKTTIGLTNLQTTSLVSFASTCINVDDGTNLYYEIVGTTPSSGFSDNTLTGIVTVTAGYGTTISKTVNVNAGNTSFNVILRTNDPSGPIVATSSTVSIGGTYVFTGSTTFSATGVNQSFVVPTGKTAIRATMWGAGGQGGLYPASATGPVNSFGGGAGSLEQVSISVTPGETLTVVVGSARVSGFQQSSTTQVATFGGGGAGGIFDGSSSGFNEGGPGGAAGGGSAIMRGASLLLVAAGGGGGGGYGNLDGLSGTAVPSTANGDPGGAGNALRGSNSTGAVGTNGSGGGGGGGQGGKGGGGAYGDGGSGGSNVSSSKITSSGGFNIITPGISYNGTGSAAANTGSVRYQANIGVGGTWQGAGNGLVVIEF